MTKFSEIMALSDASERERRLVDALEQASFDELLQAVELVFFDYSLTDTICKGLEERAEDALKIARTALRHKNPVIKSTALKLLERIGLGGSERQQDVLGILKEELETFQGWERSQEPMKKLLEESVAKVEGTHATFLEKKKQDYKYLDRQLPNLSSRQVSMRYAAIYGISAVKDPCFADVLIYTLAREEHQKNIKFLLQKLVEIHGFDALGEIAGMFDGPYVREALAAASRLGDYSVLRFLFDRLEDKLPATYYRDLLPRYGDLAVEPLLSTLKRIDAPEAYKSVFSGIFAALRSNRFSQRVDECLAQDEEFRTKFSVLMQKMFPKLLKKKKGESPTLAELRQVAAIALGGIKIQNKRLTLEMLLTPDGKSLLVGSPGKGVEIFDAGTLERQDFLSISDSPQVMNLSPDGRFLLTAKWICASRTYTVEVWKFGDWEQPLASLPHAKQVHTLGVTSDGKALCVGSENIVTVFEWGSWRQLTVLEGHQGAVKFLQAVPGKKLFMSGDWSGWLQVWDETSWKQVTRFKSDSWAPKYEELSSDGHVLVYAGYIGIKAWETETWQELFSVSKPNDFEYMTLTPDGKFLVVGKSKSLRVLEFDTWKEILRLDHTSHFTGILVTPDQKHVITSSSSGTQVWNIDFTVFYSKNECRISGNVAERGAGVVSAGCFSEWDGVL